MYCLYLFYRFSRFSGEDKDGQAGPVKDQRNQEILYKRGIERRADRQGITYPARYGLQIFPDVPGDRATLIKAGLISGTN